jgi:hypothetical protein
MTVFFDIITSAPTVFFTVPLCLAAAYWALAIVGAVDIEILDGVDGAVDGALEGIDGALDAAVDGALDAAVDGAADGMAEVADGAEPGDAADAASSGSGAFTLLANVMRLGKVPLTVSLSAFVFWGWITGFLLTWAYRNWLGVGLVPHVGFAIISMALATGIALAIMNVTVRPLEPVFQTAPGRRRASLVGETCELTTGRVDAGFGQATTQMGGDDMVFQVRCDHPGNGLRRGSKALIVHYDTRREAYVVEPLSAPRTASSATASQASTTTTHRIEEG